MLVWSFTVISRHHSITRVTYLFYKNGSNQRSILSVYGLRACSTLAQWVGQILFGVARHHLNSYPHAEHLNKFLVPMLSVRISSLRVCSVCLKGPLLSARIIPKAYALSTPKNLMHMLSVCINARAYLYYILKSQKNSIDLNKIFIDTNKLSIKLPKNSLIVQIQHNLSLKLGLAYAQGTLRS